MKWVLIYQLYVAAFWKPKWRCSIKVGPGTIAQYGGRFIARAGEVVTLEGPEENRRLIILEFPSLAKAKAWYNSEEYQNAKKLRAGASTGSLVAIDGVEANQ